LSRTEVSFANVTQANVTIQHPIEQLRRKFFLDSAESYIESRRFENLDKIQSEINEMPLGKKISRLPYDLLATTESKETRRSPKVK
jgi:hypothetical protein